MLYKVTIQQIRWSISLYVGVLVCDFVEILIYLLNVFWGKLMLSLYICAKLFADIVCHTNYRYISKYICISMLLLPIVYSQNAWRCSRSMFSTAGVCWKNSHLIVNKERKHIPNLLIDSHWCHFSQCGGNTVYPVRADSGWHNYNTAGHTEVHTLWSFCCLQRDNVDDLDDDAPLMLFIYVCVLYGYASGTHLFLMLILQNIVLCHKVTVFCK